MAVSFQIQNVEFKLRNKQKTVAWIKSVIEHHKKKCGTLNYVFMRDEDLLKVNQDFLHHNTLTDIITFDYSEGEMLHGDILISVERVHENAGKFKTDFETELQRVMIHGVLHLLGFKDKTKKDAALMRELEEWCLKKFKKAQQKSS